MKPKALIILNRLVIGGQALDTIPLLYHLKNDFELQILYGCKDKDEKEATFLIQQFSHLPLIAMSNFERNFKLVKDVKAFFFIRRAIKKFNPAIVHTHGLKSGLMGRTAAYLTGTKCIIHTYHGHHFHSYFGSLFSNCIVLMERFLARISTKIIAISAQQKEELVTKYKIASAEKIQTIPLGIDATLFPPADATARQQFRHTYGIGDDTVAIGIIGRIVPIKNLLLFAKVAATLIANKNRQHKVTFFIIGDGSGRSQLQKEMDGLKLNWCSADTLNTSADVIFTSWLQNIAGVLHGLDVVALTSHNEGTPLSLIEAQFCGKPVVATNVGGVKDTFVNGQSGFLVPPGNVNTFVEKLLILVNDKIVGKKMGNMGVEFATKNFSKTKEIDSFKYLYQSCGK